MFTGGTKKSCRPPHSNLIIAFKQNLHHVDWFLWLPLGISKLCNKPVHRREDVKFLTNLLSLSQNNSLPVLTNPLINSLSDNDATDCIMEQD